MRTSLTLSALLIGLFAQAQVTHTLTVEDDQFDPPMLTIAPGDHVHIIWDDSASPAHTFTQVEESTWVADGTTPLAGGYDLGFNTAEPGTDFTITPTGDVWYICSFHVTMGMKGMIMLSGMGIDEASAQALVTLAPNPANEEVRITAPNGAPVAVRVLDMAGRMQRNEGLLTNGVVDVRGMAPGLYVAEVRSADQQLLARKPFVVAR